MHPTAVYLDHNATTPMLQEVSQAIYECQRAEWGNPASDHFAGRRARGVLEQARERILELLNARASRPADRLIFTSGGTEANNLALRGMTAEQRGRVVVSAIEHPSVLATAEYLARHGFDVRHAPVDASGVVIVDQLLGLLDDSTVLVSVMLANNETGVVQPVRQLAEFCAERRIPFHTDAVQAVGKVPVDFQQLGVAAATFSAHKFHGPVGIGGLIVRHGVDLQPILLGGEQQSALRPGTENVPLVVGMCRALELWHADREVHHAQLAQLREVFERRLRMSCGTDIVILGDSVQRLPHTCAVAFPGLDRQRLLMALDRAGIACSAGSACASGASKPSHVLQAMGCSDQIVQGAIRISFGRTNGVDQAVWAADRIVATAHALMAIGST